jgi:hypothetical protein
MGGVPPGEGHRAKDQAGAISKAQDIVERLRRSVPTELAEPKGVLAVLAYLNGAHHT